MNIGSFQRNDGPVEARSSESEYAASQIPPWLPGCRAVLLGKQVLLKRSTVYADTNPALAELEMREQLPEFGRAIRCCRD